MKSHVHYNIFAVLIELHKIFKRPGTWIQHHASAYRKRAADDCAADAYYHQYTYTTATEPNCWCLTGAISKLLIEVDDPFYERMVCDWLVGTARNVVPGADPRTRLQRWNDRFKCTREQVVNLIGRALMRRRTYALVDKQPLLESELTMIWRRKMLKQIPRRILRQYEDQNRLMARMVPRINEALLQRLQKRRMKRFGIKQIPWTPDTENIT